VALGWLVRLREVVRLHSSRLLAAKNAREEIAYLFERTPVQRLETNQRCWGQHFDWSPTQYGIYGTSAGIESLTIAGRSPDSPLLREAKAVIALIEEPTSRFQLQRDHLNVYKIAVCVEAADSHLPVLAGTPAAYARLVSGALPSGGWPDYRHEPDEEPDATLLATAISLYALRRYESFYASAECASGLRFLADRQYGHDLSGSLQTPTLVGLSLLGLHAYRDAPVTQRIATYKDSVIKAERALTRWVSRRPERELFDQFRYDFIERPSSLGGRDSDFIALMPDCIIALAFMQAPNRLNAPRRRHVNRVIDGITKKVEKHDFKPRNVDKRAAVDHLWGQRVLGRFLDEGVMAAFSRKHRAQSASRLSFVSRFVGFSALSVGAAWASVGLVNADLGDAALITMATILGGFAVELFAGRYLK
jgi:hypothetical protein